MGRRCAQLFPLIVAAAALAGCTAVVAPPSGESASPPPLPPPPIEITAPLPTPTPVDISGLNGQRVADEYSAARFAYLPGAAQFNQLIAQTVKNQLQSTAQEHGSDYIPVAHPADWDFSQRGCVPGSTTLPAAEILANRELSATTGQRLAITCDSVLAHGPYYGQRLRVTKGTPENVTTDAADTLFAHLETGEAAPSAALLSAQGAKEAAKAAMSATGVSLPSTRPAAQSDSPHTTLPEGTPAISQSGGIDLENTLREAVSGLGFAPDGAVVFTVNSAFFAELGAPDTAPVTLRLPPERNSEFLTELGAGISQAVHAKTPWVGAPAVPAGHDFADCSLTPCVALTFDDGPSPRTPEVLQILADNHSAATFFLLGQSVPNFPEVVKQTAEAGMQIGNHSWNHTALTSLSAEGVQEQINSTNQAVEEAAGVTPLVMRPPYGDFNQATLDAAAMPAILWSIDTNDWQKPGAQEVTNRAVLPAVPGDIILVHDIHDGTIEAVPGIVSGLRARGFTLVTISQLFGEELTPGNVYYGGTN